MAVIYSVSTAAVICHPYDAVHSLHRFFAWRGGVKKILSDNGSNFTGDNNELGKAMWHS